MSIENYEELYRLPYQELTAIVARIQAIFDVKYYLESSRQETRGLLLELAKQPARSSLELQHSIARDLRALHPGHFNCSTEFLAKLVSDLVDRSTELRLAQLCAARRKLLNELESITLEINDLEGNNEEGQ